MKVFITYNCISLQAYREITNIVTKIPMMYSAQPLASDGPISAHDSFAVSSSRPNTVVFFLEIF